jgi:hypothetical protein
VQNQAMKYGYARVTTAGQSVDAQVRQLTKAGCGKVWRETASGAGYPHIYCYFAHKGAPYESIGFYKEGQLPGSRPFYTEIASREAVRYLSKKHGIKSPYL